MSLQFTHADVIAAQKELSKRSLAEFVKLAWAQLEPSVPLLWNWHLDTICEHLEATTRDELTRLIINVPPGSMKSLLVGVFWPAWEWGPAGLPSTRIIGTAYEQTLAIRDNKLCRDLISSDWYQVRWGDTFTLNDDQNAKIEYGNNKTGWRLARAFKGLTGRRGNRVIIDDPLSVAMATSDAERNAVNDTFRQALLNRLNDQERDAIVMVMQRLHEDDTTGTALSLDLGYEHLMIPMSFEIERRTYTSVRPKNTARPRVGRYDSEKGVWYFVGKPIPDERKKFVAHKRPRVVYAHDPRTDDGELMFPARFPQSRIDSDTRSMGESVAAGQLQQRPAPREGGLFKRGSFRTQTEAPAGLRWVRGWDLASTEGGSGARTAGVKMARDVAGVFYIGHAVAAALGPDAMRTLIKTTAASDGRGVRISLPQDPGAAGKVQALDMVKMLTGYSVHTSPESGDKIMRAEPFAAQVEAQNVVLIEGPWINEYLDEVTMFPNAKRKDYVDACSRAFERLLSGSSYDIGALS